MNTTLNNLTLIHRDEQMRRVEKVKAAMAELNIDNALICSNANLFYLTGRVLSGYALIRSHEDEPLFFVKRPIHLNGDNILYIHKPENIATELQKLGTPLTGTIGLELNRLTYNTVTRLAKALGCDSPADAGAAMALARSVKTPYEIEQIRISGVKHASVYHHIPQLYRPGMSDIELQIEIERLSRLEGCLGQFRVAGEDMEIHMGNILAGDNADNPSPYDFAMGGAGLNPSLPVGADGTIIHNGMTVMVDMNGNFTGYMTDMTRCYYAGDIPQKAHDAYQLSVDICHAIADKGKPGTEAKELYHLAVDMAEKAGFAEYFMGHRQHAGFVGHGIGIEINELPVIAPRSRSILQPGNVIAIEPKFVIPGTGAVGIENSYVVKENSAMECLTLADERLIKLD